jgi:hypothetical protein
MAMCRTFEQAACTGRHDACRSLYWHSRARLPTGHPSWPTRRGTCPDLVLKARGMRWCSRRVGPPSQPTTGYAGRRQGLCRASSGVQSYVAVMPVGGLTARARAAEPGNDPPDAGTAARAAAGRRRRRHRVGYGYRDKDRVQRGAAQLGDRAGGVAGQSCRFMGRRLGADPTSPLTGLIRQRLGRGRRCPGGVGCHEPNRCGNCVSGANRPAKVADFVA